MTELLSDTRLSDLELDVEIVSSCLGNARSDEKARLDNTLGQEVKVWHLGEWPITGEADDTIQFLGMRSALFVGPGEWEVPETAEDGCLEIRRARMLRPVIRRTLEELLEEEDSFKEGADKIRLGLGAVARRKGLIIPRLERTLELIAKS